MGDDLRSVQARFFAQMIRGEARADRMHVYARAYHARLIGALREDYSCLAAHLGEAEFRRVAREYVARHPSTSPSLRDLGRHFASFVSEDPVSAQHPWLADLARLEWARIDVFDAPDLATLVLDDLARVPDGAWPGVRLQLAISARVLCVTWPVHLAWRKLEDGEAAPSLAPEPTTLIVWRREYAVVHRHATSAAEAEALACVVRGEAFSRVCEAFADDVSIDGAAERALERLRQWTVDGILARGR